MTDNQAHIGIGSHQVFHLLAGMEHNFRVAPTKCYTDVVQRLSGKMIGNFAGQSGLFCPGLADKIHQPDVKMFRHRFLDCLETGRLSALLLQNVPQPAFNFFDGYFSRNEMSMS